MKNEFKVGDRVRFKGDYHHCVEDAVVCGEEYLITDAKHRCSEVTLRCPTFIDNDYLELVEPADPKAAFLSALKELLIQYDARIEAYPSGWDGETDIAIHIGEEVAEYRDERFSTFTGTYVTADNIMDYDEERV